MGEISSMKSLYDLTLIPRISGQDIPYFKPGDILDGRVFILHCSLSDLGSHPWATAMPTLFYCDRDVYQIAIDKEEWNAWLSHEKEGMPLPPQFDVTFDSKRDRRRGPYREKKVPQGAKKNAGGNKRGSASPPVDNRPEVAETTVIQKQPEAEKTVLAVSTDVEPDFSYLLTIKGKIQVMNPEDLSQKGIIESGSYPAKETHQADRGLWIVVKVDGPHGFAYYGLARNQWEQYLNPSGEYPVDFPKVDLSPR